jgi:hypothetical protein
LRLPGVDEGGLEVVLCTLAATPEPENHGAILAAARDALARARAAARLLVVVDESPFVAHLRGDTSVAARIEERRVAWREFAARHGCEACVVDLAVLDRAEQVSPELASRVRAAARTVAA